MTRPDPTADALIAEAKRRMFDESQVRLVRCLDMLSDEQIWWRPNDNCNSIGNLVLHLCGNVRQWIVCGLGGAADQRDRDAEFAERGPIPREQLLARLERTMADARAALDRVGPDDLLRVRPVQTFEESGLSIVVHVVEHFSFHAGQIAWITKMLTGEATGFYDGVDLTRRGGPS